MSPNRLLVCTSFLISFGFFDYALGGTETAKKAVDFSLIHGISMGSSISEIQKNLGKPSRKISFIQDKRSRTNLVYFKPDLNQPSYIVQLSFDSDGLLDAKELSAKNLMSAEDFKARFPKAREQRIPTKPCQPHIAGSVEHRIIDPNSGITAYLHDGKTIELVAWDSPNNRLPASPPECPKVFPTEAKIDL